MEKIFVDTDIILDLLAERKPFYDHAASLFSLADAGAVELYISALTIPNLHYIMSGTLPSAEASRRLMQFKTLVNVLPLTDKIIDLALSSDFRDVEDAFQYFTAIEHHIPVLITRNLRDYKTATIAVMTAEQFLKSKTPF
jgi:predicted nucleic acid-binding protein